MTMEYLLPAEAARPPVSVSSGVSMLPLFSGWETDRGFPHTNRSNGVTVGLLEGEMVILGGVVGERVILGGFVGG